MKLRYIAVPAIAAAAVGVFLLWPRGEGPAGVEKDEGKSDIRQSDGRERRKRERRAARAADKIRESDVKRKVIPEILESDEEKELDETMRGILKSIREALGAADAAAVRTAVARMKASAVADGADRKSWASKLPKVMRSAAVEAIGYFGVETIPDILDFIADDDPDIAQDALTQLELAMQDISLGDRDRAEIFKSLSRVLTDSEALDWMLSGVIDSRHSVGIDTFDYIAKNGTKEAKEMLPDYLDLFTGDEEVKTMEDARKWLDNNPDQPDDDDFYGPIKD